MFELTLTKDGELVERVEFERVSVSHACEPEEVPGLGHCRQFKPGKEIVTTITIVRPNPRYRNSDVAQVGPGLPDAL